MNKPILTMIPGPTPVHEQVLEALAQPTVSHQFPAFVESYRHTLEQWRSIARSDTGHPFIVSGSGTFAMEMALVNLVQPGQRILVVSHGYFGDRWEALAHAFGVECDLLRAEWGHVISAEQLGQQLAQHDYAAVTVTHVDTSTGAAAPIDEYRALLQGHAAYWILDGVCATGGVDERFDEWGVDVLVTGAQKAFGAPPGVAILMASPRAMERRRSLESIPAYNADWLRWEPVMENPAVYFSTPPVNEIFALEAAFTRLLDEGLDPRFARHKQLAATFRAGLDQLGLKLFTAENCRADTLSVVLYPEGTDDGAFRGAMMEQGVVVAAALGPVAGKAFRVGHMGAIGEAELTRTLEAIKQAL